MKKRLSIAAVLVCLVVAAIAIVLGRSGDQLRTKERKDWKANTITEIARRAGDSNWLASVVRQLKAEMAKPEADSGDWVSEHLILMRNQEWMIYANKCRKEDKRIHDIFIARGSDGKWYYSTYHFCIGMINAKVEEQPESLRAFIQRYSLVEFDGRSDECLKVTWPPKRN